MNTQEVLDPKCWAERTFGDVQRHDMRRTRRAVKAATNLAENPLGALPVQMHTWKEIKACYRWLDEPDVTFAALMQPHFQQTREQAASFPVTLLVQDTTDIDLSHRHKISGVGHRGNERGRGFFGQTVLAVRPQTRKVLGCMAQEPFVRMAAPDGQEPLEGVVLTSLPTTTLEQAWERVDWYRQRWLVEDSHQCLKSGGRIEERQLQTVDGLIRWLGLLSPLAVRLLQVRAYARCQPERLACEVIEPTFACCLG